MIGLSIFCRTLVEFIFKKLAECVCVPRLLRTLQNSINSSKTHFCAAVLAGSLISPSQNGIYPIDRAFDNSLASDSFWELSGNPWPALVEIKSEQPILLKDYSFATGRNPEERMPKEWELQASSDGEKWSVIDIRHDDKRWVPNERRVYKITSPATYKLFRLKLISGFSTNIFRIYEISLPASQDLVAVDTTNAGHMKSVASESGNYLLIFLGIIGALLIYLPGFPLLGRLKNNFSSKLIVYTLGSIIVVGLLVEGGFRVYLFYFSEVPVDRWAYRSTKPDAYKNADYFSPEFISESSDCGKLYIAPGGNFIQLSDQRGKYCNVTGGLRQTTDQPDVYEGRIMIFGGSTIFCQEVPDRDTVPSHLQRLVNNKGFHWKVENYGVGSLTAREQLNMLKTKSINAGDIVIFFDGLNEIIYPVYNSEWHGWRPNHNLDGGGVSLLPWQQSIQLHVKKYASFSKAINRMANPLSWRIPINVKDKKRQAEILEVERNNYLDVIVEANRYVVEQGAHFHHFFQPYMFTLDKLTDNERWLMSNDLKAMPGLDMAFSAGYPILREAIRSAEEKGVRTIDITNVYNSRTSEIFVDTLHVNHIANAIIAQTFYEHIFARK